METTQECGDFGIIFFYIDENGRRRRHQDVAYGVTYKQAQQVGLERALEEGLEIIGKVQVVLFKNGKA